MTLQEIAEAFTRHNFAETYEYFAEDIIWNLVGAPPAVGRDKVVRTCEESGAYLAKQTTEFSKFRLIATEDFIVIDSTATYKDIDGVASHVASCDIYRFIGTKLTEITSYNIELD